jgi:hypothetical protein
MNFYFEASEVLDRLDAKEGSIKGILATLPENNRSRTAALVIETLKCKLRCITLLHVIIICAPFRQICPLRCHPGIQAPRRRKEENQFFEFSPCPSA